MSLSVREKLSGRSRRRVRVRKKIYGTAQRPHLSIFRSAKHIYAQVINDETGVTLAALSTMAKEQREKDGKKSDRAKEVGKALAELCKGKSITQVVFDRGGYRFHGRVKAVAEGAREGGLEF